MGLFSGKKEGLPRGAFQWATNAPSSWPPFYSEDLSKQDYVVSFAIFLERAFQSWERVQGCPLKLGEPRTFLGAGGVVSAPLWFRVGNSDIPVFVFEKSTPEAAAQFAGAQAFFSTRGLKAVYYAPKPLPEAPVPLPPFKDLMTSDFELRKEAWPPGLCSMWWPSRPGERFSESACARDIYRCMRALDGCSTFVLAMLAKDLGSKVDGRMHLPAAPMVFRTNGPEGRPVAISASRENGIRLHFPENSTPPGYRDLLWYAFANSLEKFSFEAYRRLPPDLPEDRQGLRQWEFIFKTLRDQETWGGRTDHHVGVLTLPE
jgi:hypothetical protein